MGQTPAGGQAGTQARLSPPCPDFKGMVLGAAVQTVTGLLSDPLLMVPLLDF